MGPVLEQRRIKEQQQQQHSKKNEAPAATVIEAEAASAKKTNREANSFAREGDRQSFFLVRDVERASKLLVYLFLF